MIDAFFPILGEDGESRDGFEAVNDIFFEAARDQGILPTNPFTVFVPDFPESCGVEDAEDLVDQKIGEYIEAQDCLLYTEEVMCGQLDNRVQACEALNSVELQGLETWADMMETALAPLAQLPNESDDDFRDRILGEYNAAVDNGSWTLTPAGDYCDLPSAIPSTCTGDNLVSYADLTEITGNLMTTSNYHRYLEQRISDGASAALNAHQTVLALLNNDL